jgi:competence protein ComEA
MRPRGPDRAEAVSRRLRLLSAELDAVRRADDRPAEDVPPDDVPAGLLPEDGHTHIREPARAAGVPPAPAATVVEPSDRPGDPGPVVVLPRPGRHAARRGERWSPGALLAGRAALGPAQVAVVAVLVAAGLALTAWWVVRDDGAAVPVEPMAAPGLASPGPSVPAPTASASPSGEVVVDVAGKVRRPGIVVLDPGARVVDALEAAGGARAGVDLAGLNLARLLVDGEQIVVGVPAPPGPAASAAGTPAGDPGALVNLNTAGNAELEELPGVGPVTAQAIVDWRAANGGFRSVDQLLDVDGIGEKTLEDLAPLVTV